MYKALFIVGFIIDFILAIIIIVGFNGAADLFSLFAIAINMVVLIRLACLQDFTNSDKIEKLESKIKELEEKIKKGEK